MAGKSEWDGAHIKPLPQYDLSKMRKEKRDAVLWAMSKIDSPAATTERIGGRRVTVGGEHGLGSKEIEAKFGFRPGAADDVIEAARYTLEQDHTKYVCRPCPRSKGRAIRIEYISDPDTRNELYLLNLRERTSYGWSMLSYTIQEQTFAARSGITGKTRTTLTPKIQKHLNDAAQAMHKAMLDIDGHFGTSL